MKAYTDIEQSKKLAEILPIESADMSWISNGLGKPFARAIPIKNHPEEICPCWSLAALLGQLICPQLEEYILGKWDCIAFTDNTVRELVDAVDCPSAVDACVEVIYKLKGIEFD